MCGHAWHDRMPVVGAPDLHNVYYLKLSLIILIYYVTFTDLILEKGFMKVENV